MSVTDRRSHEKRTFEIPAPSNNVLMAAVLLAFLIVHVLAGGLLHHALASESDEPRVELINPACD